MMLIFRKLLSQIGSLLLPAGPKIGTSKSDDVLLSPESLIYSSEVEPQPQAQDLIHDPRLIEAFVAVLDPETPVKTLPLGTTLYRGGECKSQSPFTIRKTNIFLTSHASYAKFYTRYRNMLPYRYEYKAITTRSLQLAVVSAMKSVVAVAVEDLEIVKPNAAVIWQREHMIDIARMVVGVDIDGMYLRTDENSDEVLLDNSNELLNLDELDIYPAK